MKWIRVSDIMPDDGNTVLAYDVNDKYCTGVLILKVCGDTPEDWLYEDERWTWPITHWMAFPDPPKKDN